MCQKWMMRAAGRQDEANTEINDKLSESMRFVFSQSKNSYLSSQSLQRGTLANRSHRSSASAACGSLGKTALP